MKSDTKIGIFVVLVLVAVVVVLLGREVMNRKQANPEGEATAEALPPEGEMTDVVADAMKDDLSGQPAAPATGPEVVVVPDEMNTGLTPVPGAPAAPAPALTAEAVPAAPQDYVIQSGDTLEKISKAVYGKKSLWKTIAEANPGVNPSNLKVGARLTIPAAPASAPSVSPAPTMDAGAMTAAAGKTYTIQSGDTLEKISKTVYGKKSQWKAIAEANPGVNPSRLKVGAVLTIPEAPVASVQPASGPSASPAPSREPWKTPGNTRLVTSPRG